MLALYTVGYKVLAAWTWILLHSQAVFPPPDLKQGYIIETKSAVLHVTTNIDARPHRPVSVPLVGKDEKLLELLVWKAHYVYTGLKGRVLHRSIGGTAAMLRSRQLGVYTTSYKRIVSGILGSFF